ncbi:MAG: NAD(+)/NADH kinase [Firmicutes bacterium]|nr:NAD(+)/NADH kinase [Bacillota bacterium]
MKTVYVYHYAGSKESGAVAEQLKEKLRNAGFTVAEEFSPSVEFACVVGGDGTFMHGLRECGFPDIPFVGVNTGHLGFFQEFQPDSLDQLVDLIRTGDYRVQRHSLLQASVRTEGGKTYDFKGLTDVIFRGSISKVTHLNLAIGDNFIEKFSGDGILIASSAGSTAYNYSLGGSLVDPRVDLLQITPMAPMNTTVYRSFTSSLLVPPGLDIHIFPDRNYKDSGYLIVDGEEYFFEHVEDISVDLSKDEIQLVRLSDYDFWGKVMSKFL